MILDTNDPRVPIAVAAYQALCDREGADWQAELAEVRLVRSYSPVAWMAARLAAAHLGVAVDPDAEDPVELVDGLLTNRDQVDAWVLAALDPNIVDGGIWTRYERVPLGLLRYFLPVIHVAARQAAARESLDPVELVELAYDPNMVVTVAVASNRNTPPEALRYLAAVGDPVLRSHVAQHPVTPLATLYALAADLSPIVTKAVLPHPVLPTRARRGPYGRMEALVVRPDTPSATLAEWDGCVPVWEFELDTRDVQARIETAWTPVLHPAVAARLARDESPLVRAAVASRADCPPGMLERLTQDPDATVRFRARRAGATASR